MKSSSRSPTKSSKIKALHFLTLGFKYLNLVSNALEESVKYKNSHIIVSDEKLSSDDYYKKTKWSDFSIIEPVLFCFYHGLELIIKGLLVLTGNTIDSTHKIVSFYKNLAKIKKIPKDVLEVIERYIVTIGNTSLSNFLTENNKDVDGLYELLRYPTDKKFINFNNYIELHYRGGEVIKTYEDILKDIEKLQFSVSRFYKGYSRKK